MKALAPVISRRPFTPNEREEALNFVLKMRVKEFVSQKNSASKLNELGVFWDESDNLAVNSRRMSVALLDALKSGEIELSELD